MVENFDKMLAGSQRLEDPWYIIGAEFNEEEPAIHIHVGIDKTAALCCPVCGAPTKRYGYEPKERIWRHADCLFYPCYVHCKRPRVLCDKCGTVQVNAPFERKNSRFTLLFEGYACCSCKTFLVPEPPVCFAVTKSRSPLSLRIGCMTR